MEEWGLRPEWAPRVSRHKVARLYAQDAKGIHDEELVDEVGYALYSRVESCLVATGAMQGTITCPCCGEVFKKQMGRPKKTDPPEILVCPSCDWRLPWADYHDTYRKKRMGSARLADAFGEYLSGFRRARTYQEKMTQIDILIHRYHGELQDNPGGPGTANLIGGKMSDIAEFLDQLAYGDHSSPGLAERRERWRKIGQRGVYGPKSS